ncbi:hypothetical protein [Hymenobacter sp. DG01]|uniref:hypothetical protein n=1 Tax=Hymenobacter sp. DG01 TaxID=2584940 RepID=UPI00111CE350|nr:hypothetical protein [Hymenobacter sp. DG01]
MIRPLTIDLEGKQVKAYRNLQKKGYWSILFKVDGKEKVVAHLPDVHLLNVTFEVREKGRQRVIRDKHKNVHAFAHGTFTSTVAEPATAISYDPYLACYFYRKQDQSPVYSASQVRLTGNQAFATISDLL